MLEILGFLVLFASLTLAGLAKHKGKQSYRYRGYFFPRVSLSLALATLASEDMLISASLGDVDAPTWVSKARLTWDIIGLTDGDGPIICGLAHGDYTATEIEEWMEASAAWSTNDKIATEQASRKIRLVGSFSVSGGELTLNDGKPITTKLGFRLNDGVGIKMWAYNDGAAVLTTGALVNINGGFTCRKM